MIVKKAVLFGEYDERNMTKRMFSQLLEKNCGRARRGLFEPYVLAWN